MRDLNGNWFPTMFPKQVAVYNDTAMYVLLTGPRYCGKTLAAVHKIVRHAFITPGARVAIFVRSQKTGKNGVWADDLLNHAIPEWCENVDGFEPTEEFMGRTGEGRMTALPKTDGATRLSHFRIRNAFGGESEIQLHSLHHDEDASAKLRGTRFSCIFVDELDNFATNDIFTVAMAQLRKIGLPHDQHLWIATTNPAQDGERNWIYKQWWVDRTDESVPLERRRRYNVHEFTIDDNTFADEAFVQDLKHRYQSDPDLYDRMILGKWSTSTLNSLFSGAFRPSTHVIGDVSSRDSNQWTYLLPSQECVELFVGWDIGDVNHGVVFLEKFTTNQIDIWTVVDSVVSVGQDLSIRDLTARVLERMADLDIQAGRQLKFHHWSDKSAERYRSAADSTDQLTVQLESKGAIILRSCPKPPGSVRARIALVRRLFVANRLFISAHCAEIIDACKYLKKGKGDQPIQKNSIHLHPFDAMSYALYGESIEEIESALNPRPERRAVEITSIQV